jgi:hypothetical protein
MKIEDKRGDPLTEATLTVDKEELVSLLQGLADVAEGKRRHVHVTQVGGPQLVVRCVEKSEDDPLGRHMDWWLGPLVLMAAVLLVVGAVTVARWAAGLL